MLWLKTSGRAPITVCSASSSTPRKSGVSTSIVASGQLRLDRADRRRVMAGALVGHVVAVDRGDDDVLQPHLLRGLREPQRLERVDGLARLAGVDVAVAAGARAGLAEDLERRRAASPALGDVRAARLLADRVQPRAVDQLLHVEVAAVLRRRAHLHPLGAARAFGDGQRGLHRGQSRGPRVCGRRARHTARRARAARRACRARRCGRRRARRSGRRRDRREAMRDRDRRPPRGEAVERLLHLPLGPGVERARRLVEHQDRRVAQDRARDRDALLLAAREAVAALADDGVVALGQRRRSGRGSAPPRPPPRAPRRSRRASRSAGSRAPSRGRDTSPARRRRPGRDSDANVRSRTSTSSIETRPRSTS